MGIVRTEPEPNGYSIEPKTFRIPKKKRICVKYDLSSKYVSKLY